MFWFTHFGVVVPADAEIEGKACGPRVLFRKTERGLTDRDGRRWAVDPASGRAYRREGEGWLCAVGLTEVEGFTHRGEVVTGRPGAPGDRVRSVLFRPEKPKFTDAAGDLWRATRLGGPPCRWNYETQTYEHFSRVVSLVAEGDIIEVDAGRHVPFVPPVRKSEVDDGEPYNNGTLRTVEDEEAEQEKDGQ